MEPELLTKWIAALRSGKYEQTILTLVRKSGKRWSYCSLGVLCEVAGMRKEKVSQEVWGFLDAKGKPWGGSAPPELLDPVVQRHLAHMNDNEERSFSFIADWLEQVERLR